MTSDDLKLLQEINSKTMGHFDLFLLSFNLCPACLSDLESQKSVKYCSKCGFSHEPMGTSNTIPLGEFRSPVNSLGVGRNLGGTLGDKGMFCVLAKANGVKDLPIRAMHIRTMVRTVEHPKIMRMLSLGQIRANEWGFDDHSKMRSILFSNYLGDSLRRIGGFIVYSGLQMQLTRVVDCVFALCMKDQCGEDQFALAVQELGVDQKMVDSFAALHKLLKEIR